MSNPSPFPAGGLVPVTTYQTVSGKTVSVGGPSERWTLFVIYRGKHCGRCKPYLNKLESMKSAWEDAGFDIAVVSADPREKAAADVEQYGWSFEVGVDLSEDQMRALGLYVSVPLEEAETDRNFAEPGLFCIRPDGTAQIVAHSNGPAARPDLDQLLDGMIFTIKNDKPPRGTA